MQDSKKLHETFYDIFMIFHTIEKHETNLYYLGDFNIFNAATLATKLTISMLLYA